MYTFINEPMCPIYNKGTFLNKLGNRNNKETPTPIRTTFLNTIGNNLTKIP